MKWLEVFHVLKVRTFWGILFKTFLLTSSSSYFTGLAMDLNQEIDTQNDLIDDISDKVENADMKIHKQNRDMNKMLGKK